ncbi:LamG domain-containing protein [Streptomyces bathyalis]|uniref:LamG domain-containing protein n=1 Tax=Streptomyces bathyalis TaxID=2710756 RepID=A0A7T1T2Z0_9ACTN|nr:LamG domain-containing protein [Streptomyces bathyalis]QPP05437.1 LamG domain-containing protein [Streptomyces bathyalis]
MDCAYLSDAELVRLIWEGGEISRAALHELERRHFPAVRAYAAFGAVSPRAADELAYQAWQQALQQQAEGSVSGAVRAGALSAVLQTASAWARASGRAALNPQLAAWMEANSLVVPGSTAPAGFHRPSLVARAVAGIPCRSQTVLWHQLVERDDNALTGWLIGASPGEVVVATGRAQEELYNSYVQVLLNGMQDECRLYHRLVLAYGDTRSANVAAEVAPHLERCARCSRAVGDLGRLRHDPGTLLAQALLPWGGSEYAAQSANANQGGVREELMPGAGMAPTAAIPALPAGSQMPQGPMSGSLGAGGQGFGGRAAGKGRHAAPDAAGTGAASRTAKRRTDLVVRCTAVAGVCAVGAAFAFGFVGDSDPGKPKAKDPVSPVKASPSPSKSAGPSRATATAKSTSNPTGKPLSKPTRTRPAPPGGGSDDRPSSPAVRNVAVEWLFDKVSSDGVTPDSSANNNAGTLFGASRPRPTPGGALAFDGEQFVASNGPLIDTTGSFTVSAQVRLDRTDVSQTILSQDGSDSSAFMLQYDADESRFEMSMPEEDTGDAGSDADEAVSALEPQAGRSVHLTGVYDDADDELRLYVNGRLAGTADHEDDFASGGNFVVGRGLSGNAFFQGLDGAVDDVRAVGRAVSSAEAASLARES